MNPLGAKHVGNPNLTFSKRKKRFPDSGKACVLKRKVAKLRFLSKNDPFWGKMCEESEFDIYKIPRIQEKLYIDTKIQENNINFYPLMSQKCA